MSQYCRLDDVFVVSPVTFVGPLPAGAFDLAACPKAIAAISRMIPEIVMVFISFSSRKTFSIEGAGRIFSLVRARAFLKSAFWIPLRSPGVPGGEKLFKPMQSHRFRQAHPWGAAPLPRWSAPA